jgi:hypothetical protein
MIGDELWRALVGAFHCRVRHLRSLSVEQRLALLAAVLAVIAGILAFQNPIVQLLLLVLALLLIVI